jgi:hypothetical protein
MYYNLLHEYTICIITLPPPYSHPIKPSLSMLHLPIKPLLRKQAAEAESPEVLAGSGDVGNVCTAGAGEMRVRYILMCVYITLYITIQQSLSIHHYVTHCNTIDAST